MKWNGTGTTRSARWYSRFSTALRPNDDSTA
jgi:hypothetical protein